MNCHIAVDHWFDDWAHRSIMDHLDKFKPSAMSQVNPPASSEVERESGTLSLWYEYRKKMDEVLDESSEKMRSCILWSKENVPLEVRGRMQDYAADRPESFDLYSLAVTIRHLSDRIVEEFEESVRTGKMIEYREDHPDNIEKSKMIIEQFEKEKALMQLLRRILQLLWDRRAWKPLQTILVKTGRKKGPHTVMHPVWFRGYMVAAFEEHFYHCIIYKN